MNEFEEWMGHYDCCPTPEAYSAAKAAYQAGDCAYDVAKAAYTAGLQRAAEIAEEFWYAKAVAAAIRKIGVE